MEVWEHLKYYIDLWITFKLNYIKTNQYTTSFIGRHLYYSHLIFWPQKLSVSHFLINFKSPFTSATL